MPNNTSTPDKTSEIVSGAQVSDNDNSDIASSSATPPFLDESLHASKQGSRLELSPTKPSTRNNCSSNLNILYFNARSILPKIDYLRTICSVRSPDVICVVETWLCPDISNSELSMDGYTVVRSDRDRHGGGVMFFH